MGDVRWVHTWNYEHSCERCGAELVVEVHVGREGTTRSHGAMYRATDHNHEAIEISSHPYFSVACYANIGQVK